MAKDDDSLDEPAMSDHSITQVHCCVIKGDGPLYYGRCGSSNLLNCVIVSSTQDIPTNVGACQGSPSSPECLLSYRNIDCYNSVEEEVVL